MAYLSIRPGQYLAVFYSDDTVWHQRLALWRVKEGVWVLRTPDSDVYAEDLRGVEDGPSRVKIKGIDFRYWSRVGGPCYRFAEEPSEQELKAFIRHGHSIAMEEDDFDGGWQPTELMVGDTVRDFASFVGGSFLPHRLSGKQATGQGGVRRRALTDGERGAGHPASPGLADAPAFPLVAAHTWRSAEPRSGVAVGESLTPVAGIDKHLGPQDAVFFRNGAWLRGELVADHLYDQWLLDRVKALTGCSSTSSKAAELIGISSKNQAAPEPIATDLQQTEDGNDVRTLAVEYDDQGERYRDWRRVVSDSTSHTWPDWPHQGPASLLHSLKHFMKHGGEPRSSYQLWLRKHHLQETDRTAHEVRTLVEALWLGGCYDQLNMPCLASFEALGRRLQTIVEAYSGSTGGSRTGTTPNCSQAQLLQMISSRLTSALGLLRRDVKKWNWSRPARKSRR